LKKYYVYVIELDNKVVTYRKFQKKNPNYCAGNQCFYVGQSSREPSLRFEQHKEGYKSNKYAREFGVRLRPEFYDKYNPIPTRKDAEEIEEMIAKHLRHKGIGVWFN